MDTLKLIDPKWMFWRVVRREMVEPGSQLTRHPLNLFQALVLGYHGYYNVKPDRWHEVTEKPTYFNAPQPPGFYCARWEQIERPK